MLGTNRPVSIEGLQSKRSLRLTAKFNTILFAYRWAVKLIRIPGHIVKRFTVLANRKKLVSFTDPMRRSSQRSIIELIKKLSPFDSSFPMKRIGSKFDGGYLIPNDLSGVTAVFSPGVADNISFESYFAKKGVPVFLADASVSPPTRMPHAMSFEPLFIGNRPSPHWVSLESWVNSHVGKTVREMVLQMDIEGGEFDVISHTSSACLKRFRVIVLELHDLHRIHTKQGLKKVDSLIGKLLDTHVVVHAHANNHELPLRIQEISIPPVIELTLVEKSTIFSKDGWTESSSASGRFFESNRNCWYWPNVSLGRAWGQYQMTIH
jgi:hypothetical protein